MPHNPGPYGKKKPPRYCETVLHHMLSARALTVGSSCPENRRLAVALQRAAPWSLCTTCSAGLQPPSSVASLRRGGSEIVHSRN